MTSAADALVESWEIAVRLASARLTPAQRNAVTKSATSIAQRINRRDQRHPANLYRAAFLSEAARVLDDPFFGLNLARSTESREFGAVFYVMSAAETAIDALEDLLRYFRLTTTAMTLTITKNERDVTLAASAPIEFAEIGTQIFEWGTAILVSALRHLTKDAVKSIHPVIGTRTNRSTERAASMRSWIGGPSVGIASTSGSGGKRPDLARKRDGSNGSDIRRSLGWRLGTGRRRESA